MDFKGYVVVRGVVKGLWWVWLRGYGGCGLWLSKG